MREVLQTRNRAFGPNGVPTTSRQTSATRTDRTSRLPISLGSTNRTYEPSTHLRPAAIVRHRAAAAIRLHRPNLNVQRADYRGANLNVRAQEGSNGSSGDLQERRDRPPVPEARAKCVRNSFLIHSDIVVTTIVRGAVGTHGIRAGS